MMKGASTMNSAVRAVRPRTSRKKTVEATRQALWRSPFASNSLNTGTKAADRAWSATSDRIRLGTAKATVKTLIEPSTPKERRMTISRKSPTTREIPVARAKTAVERARRRR